MNSKVAELSGEWTHRKIYTLLTLVYHQTPNDPLPIVRRADMDQVTAHSIHNTNVTNSWLLLGLKQRGFGQGRWNGFGGKVQSDDASPKAAALREMAEESGLHLQPQTVHDMGRLWFTFDKKAEVMEVHVFMCPDWKPCNSDGIDQQWPRDTEEMHPSWFPLTSAHSPNLDFSHIPYDHMWPDDFIWLPRMLQSNAFLGWLHFSPICHPIAPPSTESNSGVIMDSVSSTNGLAIAPYKMPAYRVEFFPIKLNMDFDLIKSLVKELTLESDTELREWMRSTSKSTPNNSELLLFG